MIFQSYFQKSTKYILFIFCLSLHFYLSSPSAQADIAPEDIQSWKILDPHWAVGFDGQGKALGLYDLSFPSFSERVELGVFDSSTRNYDRALESLAQAEKQGLVQSPTEQQKLSSAIDWLKKLRPHSHLHTEGTESILPDQWWKDIPWKSPFMANSVSAPDRFYLSDIHFQKIVKDQKQFRQKLQQLGGPSILGQFEFIKNDNGTYHIVWNPPRNSENSALSNSLPPLLVDFQCLKCGLRDSLIMDGLDNVLGGLVGLIPIPIVSGLVTAALGEYFSFQRELLVRHQEMALEMIRTAEEDETSSHDHSQSSFAIFSPQDRLFAASYLLYAESTLLTALRWMGKKPQDEWISQAQIDLREAVDSQHYLEKKGQTLRLLNSRFAFGHPEEKLYLLAAPKYAHIFPPFVAIDYSHPDLVQQMRLGIETTQILISFLKPYIPIPGVGGLISFVYASVVKAPMHLVQYWEARLSSHLALRVQRGEKWDHEQELLYRQTINPFEIHPHAAQLLVEKRKKRMKFEGPVSRL